MNEDARPEKQQPRKTRRGPFKIEVIFGGSVYALGIETALDLLAGLEMATRLPPEAVALRDDLRRAIGRRSRTANQQQQPRRVAT